MADTPVVVGVLVYLAGDPLPLMGELDLVKAALHDHLVAAFGRGLQPPPSDRGPSRIRIQFVGGRNNISG